MTHGRLPAVLAVLLAAGAAFAQAQPAREATAPAVDGELRIRLDLGPRDLDPALVKSEIERELGRRVTLVDTGSAPLSVSVQQPDRLTLRYDDARSGRVERSVDLPADPRRATEVIALLVGNVVRDEAGEILRALEPPRAEPAPPEEAAPADAEPAPAPERDEPAPAAKPTPRPKPPEPRPRESSHFDALRNKLTWVNLSLFHPISLFPDSHERRLSLELGLAYSDVGAIDGAAFTLGVLSIRHHLRGAAIGTLWTHVGGPVRGFSSALIYDGSDGPLEGVSMGGIVSLRPADMRGFSAAVAVSSAHDVEGVQASGAVNSARSLQGSAFTAGVNVVDGHTEGAIGAGALNVTSSLRGAAVAGGVNVTGDAQGALVAGGVNVARDVQGVSIALINVNRRVEGLQIGAVNIASEIDGAAIGLVNVAGNGRVQPVLWSSTRMPLHAGVRFIAGYAYSELGWALSPKDETHGPEAGAGVHLDLSSALSLEPGVHYSHVSPNSRFTGDGRGALHYRLRAGVRLLDRMELFAGGGVVRGLHGTAKDEVKGEGFVGVAVF